MGGGDEEKDQKRQSEGGGEAEVEWKGSHGRLQRLAGGEVEDGSAERRITLFFLLALKPARLTSLHNLVSQLHKWLMSIAIDLIKF